MAQFNPSEQELEQSFDRNANGAVYTGAGDFSLDFESSSSFANETASKRSFSVELKNIGAEDAVVALCPAHYNDAALLSAEQNIAVDFIAKDGEQTKDEKKIVIKGSPSKISQLLSYTKQCATRVHTMIVKVSEEGMLDNPFQHRTVTPFAGGENLRNITPANYVDENTQNAKMATVDCQSEDLQLSPLRLVLYRIPAGQNIKITMLMGASENRDLELSRKAKEGRINVASKMNY